MSNFIRIKYSRVFEFEEKRLKVRELKFTCYLGNAETVKNNSMQK